MSFQLASLRSYQYRHYFGEQVPPVLNQWYTLLDLINGGIIYGTWIRQSNDETAQKQIDYEITIDGNTIDAGDNLLDSTPSHQILQVGGSSAGVYEIGGTDTNPRLILGNAMVPRGDSPLWFHTLNIRYRITSALGTNQTLTCSANVSEGINR